MEAKLIIPVIDTESGNFDTDIKLTREEYIDMVNDNFIRNDKAINHYMTHEWGTQRRQNFANEVSNKQKVGFKNGCGCRLKAKTSVINAECPVGKW